MPSPVESGEEAFYGIEPLRQVIERYGERFGHARVVKALLDTREGVIEIPGQIGQVARNCRQAGLRSRDRLEVLAYGVQVAPYAARAVRAAVRRGQRFLQRGDAPVARGELAQHGVQPFGNGTVAFA
jgi:hypothetical protein